MLYQREPILPVDIEFSEDSFVFETSDTDWDLDEKAFTETVHTMLQLRSISIQ